ncbi:MAG TPA: MFS transporter [Anaerolineales bacterium]|nr:MFS transporter [Anaerolineales bacterium]
MKKPVSILQMLVVNTYWVGLSFMWNGLHGIILPAVIANLVPGNEKNTYLGLLTSIGLVIAVIIQPLSGALSDSWASRWGRRRPWITLGTLFDFVFLAVIGWAGGLTWIFIGYLGLQLSSNIAHGPTQGLLPDVVPPEQLAQASGLKIFIDMGSAAAAVIVTGILLGSRAEYAGLVMALIIGIMLVSAAITVFGTPEQPSARAERGDPWKEMLDSFHIDFRANTAYWWLIGQRFVFLLGVYGIQAFAQNYLRDVLNVADPPRDTGLLLGIVTMALILFAAAGGWLIKGWGMKRVLVIASLIAALGSGLLWFGRTQATILVFGSILGAGVGLFLTANWTLANKLAPPAEAGKYLGLTNLATAGAGVVARAAGALWDLLNNAAPGSWNGYMILFFSAGVLALFSIALIGMIEPASKKAAVPA